MPLKLLKHLWQVLDFGFINQCLSWKDQESSKKNQKVLFILGINLDNNVLLSENKLSEFVF